MKSNYEIVCKINEYKNEIKNLNQAIKDCIEYQRENNMRITRECDYIKGREQLIVRYEAKTEVLEWVLK